jgi:hypothetical protein
MAIEPVTHLERTIAGTAEPVTHLEKTIAGTVEPVTHLEKVIEQYGGGGQPPSGTISITENGTYDVTEYAEAEVGVPVGIPFYSGTLTLASRPAETGTFATLNAPNCTHFLIYADTAPSNTTDNAYMGFAFWEKNAATFAMGSNNAGSGIGMSGAGYTWNFTSQTLIGGGISCSFGGENIELSTTNATSSTRFPQVGCDYLWFAW